MGSIASSVRITGDAMAVLSNLAATLGTSKAQVIETALRELEERIFWAEVRDSFARTAADPEECARKKAEIEIWERCSADDFKDEEW
jgi:hypothetical protein